MITSDQKNVMINEVQSLIDTRIPVEEDSIITGEALNAALNAIIEIL